LSKINKKNNNIGQNKKLSLREKVNNRTIFGSTWISTVWTTIFPTLRTIYTPSYQHYYFIVFSLILFPSTTPLCLCFSLKDKMTICVEQFDFGMFFFLIVIIVYTNVSSYIAYNLYVTLYAFLGSQFEDKNVHSEEIHELVLDGGFVQPKQDSHDAFVAPDINAFGHTFRLVAIQFPFHCFYQFIWL
jgi:hypothetical protein